MSNVSCKDQNKQMREEMEGERARRVRVRYDSGKNAPSGRPIGNSFGSLRANTDTSPPGLCIIYKCWHILRLNICWFVKSTKTRSCLSVWPSENSVAHLIDESRWWWPEAQSSLPFFSSPAPTEDIREEKREAHKWVGESGGHWARSQLPIQRRQLPGSTRPAPPPSTYLHSLLFMLAFTLKHQQHTWRQRWIGKQAGGGRVAPFVKTVAGC